MGRGVSVVRGKRLLLIGKRIKLPDQGGKKVDRTRKQGNDFSTPETAKAGENPGKQFKNGKGWTALKSKQGQYYTRNQGNYSDTSEHIFNRYFR